MPLRGSCPATILPGRFAKAFVRAGAAATAPPAAGPSAWPGPIPRTAGDRICAEAPAAKSTDTPITAAPDRISNICLELIPAPRAMQEDFRGVRIERIGR